MENKHLWMFELGDILEVYEQAIDIGKKRGLKPGDSITDIIVELLNKRKKAHYLGTTDQDPDMLRANLRENGIYPKKKEKNKDEN